MHPSTHWLIFCSAVLLWCSPDLPAQTREQMLERQLEALEKRLRRVEKEMEGSPQDAERQSREESPASVQFTPFWSRDEPEVHGPLRDVYDKPFLLSAWQRVHIGGYTESEYHGFEEPHLGIPQGFRMHRTNIFLFSEVAETIRFGSELEFETEFSPGHDRPSSDIEVKVEMAFVDWMLSRELTLRAGAILVPIGRTNVNHDGPVRQFTDRSLVDRFVIPTTYTDAGVGLHGDFEVEEAFSIGYQAYAINGLNLLNDGQMPVPVTELGDLMREGRKGTGGDNNKTPAGVGRLAFQILDLAEVGGSLYGGTYDDRNDNVLFIYAGDTAIVQPLGSATLVLEGEVSVADFQRDAIARAAGIPDRFWGYYAQGSIHGMPEVLRRCFPRIFDGPGTEFSLALKYDFVDLAGDEGSAIEPGINFKPVADTVLKLSYRFNQKSIGDRALPGHSFDDSGFIFSISTYF